MPSHKSLGYLLCQSKRIYRNLLMTKLKENGVDLGLEQFVILDKISLEEDLTQQDLANHLQKDKSNILRQINALIDRKYVERLRDGDDKRKKKLILTKDGQQILDLTRGIAQRVSAELLSGLDKDDLRVFMNVLEKIQEHEATEDPPILL